MNIQRQPIILLFNLSEFNIISLAKNKYIKSQISISFLRIRHIVTYFAHEFYIFSCPHNHSYYSYTLFHGQFKGLEANLNAQTKKLLPK